MKIEVFNTQGKSAGNIDVSDTIFGAKVNPTLIHQVVVAMRANQRQSSAHTKDRSEVSGSGKKPWRQKGTGRARHGQKRSPIWRTGGITFGPRNDRDYTKKINKKMKIAALYGALSGKLTGAQVLFVENLNSVKTPSTKTVSQALGALTAVKGFETLTFDKPSNICIVLPKGTPEMISSIRNLGYADVTDALNLNTLDIVNHRYIVIVDPKESSNILASRHFKNKITSDTNKTKKVADASQ